MNCRYFRKKYFAVLYALLDYLGWKLPGLNVVLTSWRLLFDKKTGVISLQEYTVSEQRKADQKEVDTPILAAIKKHPEHKFLFGYMGSRFALGKNQYPHEMVF